MPTSRAAGAALTKTRSRRTPVSAVALPPVPTELLSSAFLELAPDALVVTDAAGHILLANHQTEALFGYARPDLLGQTVELLLPNGSMRGINSIEPSMWRIRIRAQWGLAWSWWGDARMAASSPLR